MPYMFLLFLIPILSEWIEQLYHGSHRDNNTIQPHIDFPFPLTSCFGFIFPPYPLGSIYTIMNFSVAVQKCG